MGDNMRVRGVSLFLILILAAVPLVGYASADNDGLFVVMTRDSDYYGSGDDINVEVHVFHNGERVDADEDPVLDFRIYDEDYDSESREVDTQKKEMGIYGSEIELYDSDIQGSSSAGITLKKIGQTPNGDGYSVSHGMGTEGDLVYDFIEEWDTPSTYIYFEGEEEEQGFTLTYVITDMDSYPWMPGDSVHIEFNVKDDGKMAEPDEFDVYSECDTEDEQDVPFNNPAVGVYEADLKIPSSIKSDDTLELSAAASLGEEYAGIELEIPIFKYYIWNHMIYFNEEECSFEIFVSDLDGKAVGDMDIGFEYYNGSNQYMEGRTDNDGGASFLIKSGGRDSVEVDGWVDDGIFNQSFSGYVTFGEDDEYVPQPSGYGLDILEYPDAFDTSGGKVTAKLRAFLDGEEFSDSTLHYYAYSQKRILGFGSRETDGTGNMTIQFDKPDRDESVEITFKAQNGYHAGVFEGYDREDSDGDGFGDDFEVEVGSDPDDSEDYPCSYMDSDYDDFGDEFEVEMGTDPDDYEDHPCSYMDSDDDGFGDRFEESESTDPLDSQDYPSDLLDTDGDGFGDDFEVDNGTDPYDGYDYPDSYPDSDHDGHPDGEEEFYGTDPQDAEDYPQDSYRVNSDGDSLGGWYSSDEQYDLEEEFYGTDPQDAEDYPQDIYDIHSDYDGVCDEEEDYYGTDPQDSGDYPRDIYDIHSDYDGICDEEEKFYGTDPEDYYSSPDYEPSPWDERYSDHNSTDGKYYEMDSVYYTGPAGSLSTMVSDKVLVEVESMGIGRRTKVTIKCDGGSSMGFCGYYVGDINDIDLIEEEIDTAWEMWSEDGFTPAYRTGSGMVSYITVPEFLPGGDQKYTILAGLEGEDYMPEFNYVVLKEGQSGNSKEGVTNGGSSIWKIIVGACLILILLVMITVILVAISAMVRKRKKRDEAKKAPELEQRLETPSHGPPQPLPGSPGPNQGPQGSIRSTPGSPGPDQGPQGPPRSVPGSPGPNQGPQGAPRSVQGPQVSYQRPQGPP